MIVEVSLSIACNNLKYNLDVHSLIPDAIQYVKDISHGRGLFEIYTPRAGGPRL